MTTNTLMLKRIVSSDIDSLKTLSIRTFKETFENQNTVKNMDLYLSERMSKKALLNEIENPDSHFYFSYLKNKCIGYLKLNFNGAQTESVFNDNAFEIQRIYILKEFQGNGWGSQLFEKAIQLGMQKNYKKLWLGVWEMNYNALVFYQKKGFKAYGRHVFELGTDSQIDILMSLEL